MVPAADMAAARAWEVTVPATMAAAWVLPAMAPAAPALV